MTWLTFTRTTAVSTVEGAAVLVCVVLVVILAALYYKLAERSRRRFAELKEREEQHKVALALVAQNIERHDQEVLATEINERRRVEASLSHATYHDQLTGVRNRSFFLHELRKILERKIPRPNSRVAVLCIDIDGFKAVNGTMGQKFGDLLICEVSRRIASCMRNRDTLARIGGDDFAVLLNGISGADQARRIAQRILSAIGEPALLSDIRLSLTASIGLCAIEDHYVEAEDVLRDADIAMYDAKRQGGDRCVQYDESMRSEAFAALKLKQQLRAALANDEFVIFYMPLVDMTDYSIYGVEALIRWNHPLRGLLAPDEFIQAAQECDIIVGIGSWVLKQACRDFRELKKLTDKELILSINISSRQLDQECFLAELSSAIKETGIRPQSLQLELLESVVITNAERMGTLFRQIRSLGVKVAFDDFGTGYSSLSYLARYPIDALKIDQSFVKDMKKGSVNADIVQLVIKLAQTVGMEVSAEGVEEPQQAADLIDYGCTVGQGYLYSRPIPLEEISTMVAKGHVNC